MAAHYKIIITKFSFEDIHIKVNLCLLISEVTVNEINHECVPIILGDLHRNRNGLIKNFKTVL